MLRLTDASAFFAWASMNSLRLMSLNSRINNTTLLFYPPLRPSKGVPSLLQAVASAAGQLAIVRRYVNSE